MDAAHNLVVLLSEQKDRDPLRELELLESIVREDPDYAPAHLSLGRFFQSEPMHRDLNRAYQHYDRFIKTTDSDDPTIDEVVQTMRAIRSRLDR